jgi:uncharacterized membrane protein YphA (DoxX/SURF4 family)
MKVHQRLIRRLLFVGRIAFGILFAWAAAGKVVDPDRFAQQVARYQIIGAGGSGWVGAVLPWIEFTVGSCLLTGLCTAGAWLGAVLLCGCFVFARTWVLARGMSIECGCGVMEGTINGMSVFISTAMLLTSMGAYVATLRMSWQSETAKRARIKGPAQSSSMSGKLDAAGASPCA